MVIERKEKTSWGYESIPKTVDSFKDISLENKYLCFVSAESEMIHIKYTHFSLKNDLALNFQRVFCLSAQAWHVGKHTFKLLWIFTETFGLLPLGFQPPAFLEGQWTDRTVHTSVSVNLNNLSL